MTTNLEALNRALDHAPAIAMVSAEQVDWAMHAASACVAAGFQLMAIGSDTPSGSEIVASIGARPNMLVGMARVRKVSSARDAVDAGAAFLMSATTNPDIGDIAKDAGLPWVPGAWSPNEIESALKHGADMIQLCPIGSAGGPLHVRLMQDIFPETTFIAEGGIGGDRLSAYFDAGARAVVLSEALYSRDLMAAGDHVSIRNHAAAAHRDASQHGRIHGERA